MAVEPTALTQVDEPGDGMLRLCDPRSGYTFLLGSPQLNPIMWRRCMDGARDAYRRYDAEDALEYDAVIDGHSTTMFGVALDAAGQVVAGVRAEGPHRHVDTVHAVTSWRGMPGEAAFRKMVADQIPEGVIECKAGWTARDVEHRSALADWVARSIVHFTMLLGVRYAVGVAPEHALACYRSSGATFAWWIPATSYPDDRYRTVPVWWDLQTFRSVASDCQVRLIDAEMTELAMSGSVDWVSRDEGLAQA